MQEGWKTIGSVFCKDKDLEVQNNKLRVLQGLIDMLTGNWMYQLNDDMFKDGGGSCDTKVCI